MRTAIVVGLLLFVVSSVSGQYLPEEDKRAILRIETTENNVGTGFMLLDPNIGDFIVTNKHVLKSVKTGQYFDSVFVWTNKLENGKVVATNNKATLYLRYHGVQLYVEHDNPNVDLVFVQCAGPLGISPTDSIQNPSNYGNEFVRFKVARVCNREDMEKYKIETGTSVQLIGFSFEIPSIMQFHISRFGNIAVFPQQEFGLSVRYPTGNSIVNAEWLVLDITSRGGDSGGPVFAFPDNVARLIGFTIAVSNATELSYAQPSYYIWDLIQKVKTLSK